MKWELSKVSKTLALATAEVRAIGRWLVGLEQAEQVHASKKKDKCRKKE